GGAPQVTGAWRPLPRMVRAPFADAEYDRSAGFGERVAELGVLGWCVEPFGVAPILLDVVHAPLGIGSGVNLLGAVRTGPSLARLASRVGVDPELESLGMHVVSERLHAAGEAGGIGDDAAGPVARHLPAVVDHDVVIAGVAHAARDDCIRGFLDELGAHVAAEMVPAVPAHGRSAGQAVVERRRGGSAAEQRDRGQADEQRVTCGHRTALLLKVPW